MDWQDEFQALGVNMAAMSYDPADVLAEFGEAKNIGYALLSDGGGAYLDSLGIRNEEYQPGHFAHGVPHPGILFIDTDGIIRLKRAVPGFRDRPSLDELHDALAAELAKLADLAESSELRGALNNDDAPSERSRSPAPAVAASAG